MMNVKDRISEIRKKAKDSGLVSAAFQTLLNIAALLPLICFAFRHYTSDSYLVAFHYDWHWSAFIGSYRWFGALLIRLWTAIADPVADPLPDTVLFILLSAAGVTMTSRLLYKKLSLPGRFRFAVIDLAV